MTPAAFTAVQNSEAMCQHRLNRVLISRLYEVSPPLVVCYYSETDSELDLMLFDGKEEETDGHIERLRRPCRCQG
jgi:hypothetical protein